jgi:hypothetical protein
MKNEHLIPVNIVDLVNKFNEKNLRENEKMNYQIRLETIRDYCSAALNKPSNQKINTRVSR